MSRLRRVFGSVTGFSLAEVLVVAAVIGIVLTGLITLQQNGQLVFLSGTNRVEAQEAGRIALQRMLTELRMAGNDPQGATNQTNPPWTRIAAATSTSFVINNDWNGSGTVDTAQTYNVNGVLRGEQISYALAGSNLLRRESGLDAAPQSVIDNVDALTFTYFDASNVALAPPVANPSAIRSIGIALRTRPAVQPPSTSARVWFTLDDRVRIRN